MGFRATYWGRAMKALLAGIAFVIGMVLAARRLPALSDSQVPEWRSEEWALRLRRYVEQFVTKIIHANVRSRFFNNAVG